MDAVRAQGRQQLKCSDRQHGVEGIELDHPAAKDTGHDEQVVAERTIGRRRDQNHFVADADRELSCHLDAYQDLVRPGARGPALRDPSEDPTDRGLEARFHANKHGGSGRLSGADETAGIHARSHGLDGRIHLHEIEESSNVRSLTAANRLVDASLR